MAIKFAICTTDIAATLNPWAADPQPTKLIDLGEEPLFGTYEAGMAKPGRGGRIQTLAGGIDQDFGVMSLDGQIKLAVENAPMASGAITDLLAAWEANATQYYFTDSVNCWKVKFARPDGCQVWRNMMWKAHGANVYSYELLFNVDSKEI